MSPAHICLAIVSCGDTHGTPLAWGRLSRAPHAGLKQGASLLQRVSVRLRSSVLPVRMLTLVQMQVPLTAGDSVRLLFLPWRPVMNTDARAQVSRASVSALQKFRVCEEEATATWGVSG